MKLDKIGLVLSVMAIFVISFVPNSMSFSEPQTATTDIIPIDDIMGLERTLVNMNVQSDNKLPWGFVEGKIANHVNGYPVIIQIYDNDDEIPGNALGAVHFAQTDVNEDGTYEYRFRVLDVNNDEIIHIFEGDYTVKIFKVVYLNPNLQSA